MAFRMLSCFQHSSCCRSSAQLGLHHDIHDIFLRVIQLDGQKHCLF